MAIPGFTAERTTCRPHTVHRRAARAVGDGFCPDECRDQARQQCQNSYDPQACTARAYQSCMRACTYEPYCYDVQKHDPDGSIWQRTVCEEYDGSIVPQTPWCRTAHKCEGGILSERTECQQDDGTVSTTPWLSVDVC